ncbi:G2/M phase-specific E3 ubiquitin-protein ligase-like [Polypterus senegalus]|uniref:G2/M phase-specific E3 ubiquitin-protein ligase-like n=1 Tax=Polypterus senegalus TaxID=55291 RepID=UPI0019668775|nr:G2/M phase-specific E3 ubiquitin-protein ligase-like [Polypterus senegalus]
MVKPFCLLLGLAKDEYYIIGRVIAVSLVHGGPAPHFFSRHFVEYICGKTDVSPSIEDVTDPDIQNVLQEIQRWIVNPRCASENSRKSISV